MLLFVLVNLSDIGLNHYRGKVLIWQENVAYAERNPLVAELLAAGVWQKARAAWVRELPEKHSEGSHRIFNR
jgi:hypothetical protein